MAPGFVVSIFLRINRSDRVRILAHKSVEYRAF